MTRLLFSVALLLLCKITIAQKVDSTTYSNPFSYHVSYLGNNIWNPGLKLGAEYILGENVKVKVKKRGVVETRKYKTGQFLLDGNLGMYWDPKSHTGVFTYYGIHYRRIKHKGFRFRAGICPIGYYRSFLPDTYEVNSDGAVSKVAFPGHSYYAPTITFGIGKKRKGDRLLQTWHINVNSMFLIPYNTGFTPLLNVEFGFGF